MPNERIMLVEGSDDEHVLRSLCENRHIPQPTLKPLGGVDAILETIPVRLKAGGPEGDVVGVVIDADANLDIRWRAIRDRFIQAGYQNVPDQPDPNGTIIEASEQPVLPRAGIWIMPNNETDGILEDFLTFLIPQGDELLEHANISVDSIPIQHFSDNDKPKAVIHTWLAWQEDPGKPYGTAITAKFLDPTVPQVDILEKWVRRLFVEEESTP